MKRQKRTLGIYYPIYIYQGKDLPFIMLETFNVFAKFVCSTFQFFLLYGFQLNIYIRKMTLCVSVENQITIAESNLCSFPISFWQNNSASSSVEQFQLLNFIVCVSRSTCENIPTIFVGMQNVLPEAWKVNQGRLQKKRENVGILEKQGFGGGLPQIHFFRNLIKYFLACQNHSDVLKHLINLITLSQFCFGCSFCKNSKKTG